MVRVDSEAVRSGPERLAPSQSVEFRSWVSARTAGALGPVRTLELDAGARVRAARLPSMLPGVVSPEEHPRFWETLGRLRLQHVLHEKTLELVSLLRTAEVVWVKGFAPERDPGPAAYESPCEAHRIADTLCRVMGAIDLMDASAFAFADENHGRLVRHVVARPDAQGEVSSQGWSQDLPWHMDGAFRPFHSRQDMAAPARWLVFGVINTDPNVPMVITSAAEAVRRLSPAARLALGRAEFAISTPDAVEPRRVVQHLPILDRDPSGRLVSRLSIGHCEGLTPAARAALGEFETILDAPDLRHELAVSAGDLVVLDNWRVLHRRSAYDPSWDGADRWMVRVYASPTPRDPTGVDARRLRP